MPHQEAVTLRAWIRSGAVEPLDALLRHVGDDIESNTFIPFAAFDNVHFARLVILPETKDVKGRVIAPSLVYAANVDGPGDAHLRDLVRIAADGLDRIFAHCQDYPESPDESSRYVYLAARQLPTQAFYVNTVGRTAKQVREEAMLRDALEQELDRLLDAGNLPAANAVRDKLRHFIATRQDLAFARHAAEPLPLGWRIRERLAFFGTLLILLLLLPLLLLAAPFFAILLRSHEKRDAKQRQPLHISTEEQFDLRLLEDHVVQNQISAVGNVKAGPFRNYTMRVLLGAINFGAKHVFNRGDLGTVRLLRLYGVDTIHFAQWVIIDEGRRAIFFSNYDGSLVSYMDDFVNKVAWGLNAVFSNGELYPNTRWLVLDGAHDEQQFKAYLYRHQIPTQAWYSAHRKYSAINLTNNAALRRGVLATAGDEATAWLARL